MTDLKQYVISPVETQISPVTGFNVAGLATGIRKSGRRDMALIVSATPCTAAGVFTTNLVKAAPVLLDQQHLAQNASGIRAVVVNAGVANACTGAQGMQDAVATADHTAAALGCAPADVLVMSTGVIGTTLPMDKITAGVDALAGALAPDGWADAAEGIMTTDTVPKTACITVETPDGAYTIAGIAKGSGMIAPNMATMLATVVTDAALDAAALQGALSAANGQSFNQIVVDGDMSTNDSVLLLANGASGVSVTPGEGLDAFQAALAEVCTVLAKDIVMDGEGATRFITLHITGAADDAAARQVGMAIATSPLVKTAFYGADANWGRILAAAGRAGVALDPARLALWIAPGESDCADGLQLVTGGSPTAYSEDEAAAIMSSPEVSARLDLGAGAGQSTIWTCDLSHEYVSINGHYRT
ncbi:MAG: bifunctional glutamate N-acetyltransferase/amino-acid acetyltransferase ArgJ [Anaerolineae bacterium]|nr:bifunctional glutamate N-acetyltransferase/amino-acid acetyltransferase ArgJ [Anaerolineae bacterium]